MFSVAPHPEETPWGEATRVEEDPTDRIRDLRFMRLAGTLVTALVGLGLVGASLLVLRGSGGALPSIVYFGAVGALLALSPGCWLALTLTLRRVPNRIAFDEQRLMVHQLDGQVREVAWTDPDLALDLLNLGASDFSRGTILLTSRMKRSRLDAAITIEGAAAFRAEAIRQGLHVEAREEGKPPKAWGVVEIRRSPARLTSASSVDSPASTPQPAEDPAHSMSSEAVFEYGQ